MVGAYEAGLPAGRRHSSVVGTDSDFPDDIPYARDTAAYGRSSQHQRSAFAAAIFAVLRLVFPIILLLTTFAASYLYNDTKLAALGIPADGLTLGYLLLPTTFFAIQLTNRRYGPGYAFAQVVTSWLAAAIGLLLARLYLPDLNLPNPFPDARIFGAFALALFLAQTAAIIVFDGARGPRWWSAPLFSSLWGGAIFCGIFYPVAYFGVSAPWLNDMLLNLGLMAAMAIALIAPYWLLRPLVRPLPGYGGY